MFGLLLSFILFFLKKVHATSAPSDRIGTSSVTALSELFPPVIGTADLLELSLRHQNRSVTRSGNSTTLVESLGIFSVYPISDYAHN